MTIDLNTLSSYSPWLVAAVLLFMLFKTKSFNITVRKALAAVFAKKPSDDSAKDQLIEHLKHDLEEKKIELKMVREKLEQHYHFKSRGKAQNNS